MNIQGLDKAQVLAALFNASKQQGMGLLDGRGAQPMTVEHARELLDAGQTHFDYLYGRVMKISLAGDEVDPWGYDRDNGHGAAEKAIAHLRNAQGATEENKGFSLEQWAATPQELFNLKETYLAEVEPEIQRIKEKCIALGLPAFFIVAVSADLEGVEYHGVTHFPGAAKTSAELLEVDAILRGGPMHRLAVTVRAGERAEVTKAAHSAPADLTVH